MSGSSLARAAAVSLSIIAAVTLGCRLLREASASVASELRDERVEEEGEEGAGVRSCVSGGACSAWLEEPDGIRLGR
ncbi:hypothetical protein BDY21DRAFT_357899 [Lineolata rhizophorae]|uniref:Uncharacterized protein n=1 Tax=Lineolata rhizophorae TaxID=578093 RepID=A0A6A6NMP0_9PEZI|nr:hypothetical protein BDY21DRAFT_357899 [Lineolata rhizophorae]